MNTYTLHTADDEFLCFIHTDTDSSALRFKDELERDTDLRDTVLAWVPPTRLERTLELYREGRSSPPA